MSCDIHRTEYYVGQVNVEAMKNTFARVGTPIGFL